MGKLLAFCSPNDILEEHPCIISITGIIAGGITPSMAAPLGVFIHGLCGDEASEKLSAHFVCASDIIDMLSVVLKEGLNFE